MNEHSSNNLESGEIADIDSRSSNEHTFAPRILRKAKHRLPSMKTEDCISSEEVKVPSFDADEIILLRVKRPRNAEDLD